jgi:hypothetical protein
MAINREALQRLVEEARGDQQFFHDLMFDPEQVIGKLEYLSREQKARVLELRIEDVFIDILRPQEMCGDTCGSASCTGTCGEKSCDGTCASSCGNTCSSSCTDTTKLPLGPTNLPT